ncbi:MAG: sigma-54 dependent transcriptional regulator [Melioribacteraceae bacterium]|nr:MAG: sigma-54 dependent transcriptional regulator [Melioribacteraceae bacterium]
MNKKILAIDDDSGLLASIKKTLELTNYVVTTLNDPSKYESIENVDQFQAILLDIKMPKIDGLELLTIIHSKHPHIPIIMISGESDIQTAVQSLKDGAYDFIEKPIDPDKLLVTIKNAVSIKSLYDENIRMKDEISKQYSIVYESIWMEDIMHKVEHMAPTRAKVLIYGESGTGKELIARALHEKSDRRDKPYVKINCASIPSELLESEFFGHKKGSFTGAANDHEGKFIQADGGTLFLDEIGDMDLRLQSKLLRAVEESEVELIGDNKPRKVDVRVICATNKNLPDLVKQGKFREDLFHRLNVVKINIPPLRDRKDDIPKLVEFYIKKFNEDYNKKIEGINARAVGLLKSYDWPGNVRELKNLIEKVVIYNVSNTITFEDIINSLDEGILRHLEKNTELKNFNSLKEARQEFEKRYILKTLNEYEWKIQETANALGIDRTNLFKKMKSYEIEKS